MPLCDKKIQDGGGTKFTGGTKNDLPQIGNNNNAIILYLKAKKIQAIKNTKARRAENSVKTSTYTAIVIEKSLKTILCTIH